MRPFRVRKKIRFALRFYQTPIKPLRDGSVRPSFSLYHLLQVRAGTKVVYLYEGILLNEGTSFRSTFDNFDFGPFPRFWQLGLLLVTWFRG